MAFPYNLNKWFENIQLGKVRSTVSLFANDAGKLVIQERRQDVRVILDDDMVRYARLSVAVADLAAGQTIVAAVPGYRIRMVSCKAEATVADATTSTTVDVLGTQAAASVKLVAYTTTALDRALAVADGTSSGVVLNDGASYDANDAGTAIIADETGSATAGATAIVFYFSYVLET